MERTTLISRCIMSYVIAVAAPFIIAELLVGPLNDNGNTIIGYHPKATPIIAQQYKVKTLEERVHDFESGGYAKRFAAITHTSESVVALETKLSGKIKETRTELVEAKIKLAQLTR